MMNTPKVMSGLCNNSVGREEEEENQGIETLMLMNRDKLKPISFSPDYAACDIEDDDFWR